MSTNPLETLAAGWRAAKADEEAARKRRVEIEEAIIAQTGCKEEGSQTVEAGDWKIRITGKLNRKLDADKWAEIEPEVPAHLLPVDYKPALNTKGLRYLEKNEPDTYRLVAQAIETKPAKPSIEVK